jgi:hypothetical protein
VTDHHDPPHEGQEEYQEDRAADRHEREDEANRLAALAESGEKSHRRIAVAQLVAYVMIVAVFAFSSWQAEQQDEHICESAHENREATRALVIAIGDLGTDLVVGNDDPDSPTPEQQATLDKFAKFQAAQLAALAGPVCVGD